eukprot:TRINITY_DN36035_c0_g1_i1.p1 TRINITY_DN36035_c0_g1~~TRINITY_DN36035_c0_g1_i1.p1  ORF type:complete len:1318 (-),score=384.14 TRINITY_DN36035_c0_g1_i1:211-4164(-)
MAPAWKDVEDVFSAEEAAALHEEVSKELSSDAFIEKCEKAMYGGAPTAASEALLVLGPSGAGKSYALKHGKDILQVAIDGATLDGAIIREQSETWKKTLAHAADKGLAGYANFFKDYFKGPMDRAKTVIARRIMSSRGDGKLHNLVVPDTASDFSNTKRTIDELIARGYTLKVVAVYAAKSKCEERGKARESAEGKKYSSKNWANSVQSIVDVQTYLAKIGQLGQSLGGVRIVDNTDKVQKMTLRELRKRLPSSHAAAASEPLETQWCETKFLAGTYDLEGEEPDAYVKIRPESSDEELVNVTIDSPQGELEATFDVNSCLLKAKVGGSWQLGVAADGRAVLTPVEKCPMLMLEGSKLTERANDPASALEHSLVDDKALLKALEGKNFFSAAFRDLSEEEFQAAAEAAGCKKAPKRDAPRALFVVAPSGGGKTTVLKSVDFGMKIEECVLADSAIFRDFHAQYKSLLDNGLSNKGIWHCAWPAVKDVVSKAKKRIWTMASEQKQDLLVSDTGSDAAKLVKSVQELKGKGYTVHLCGVFADPHEIMQRGVAREVGEGKRYNRSVSKLKQTFDAFAPVVKEVNGDFRLVKNASGLKPEVYKEGRGGDDITFDLKRALVMGPEEPQEAELDVAELTYIMEGNLNIVCSYKGSKEAWRSQVLRCRKGDNSTYRMDCAFASGVAAKILGKEYVDTGVLVSLSAENMKAIDEGILEKRPQKRREKRLDTKVRDRCGRVLALKVPNLMGAPVPEGVKVVTVELKPKCGLKERYGVASRYKCLQYEKLRLGKIDAISDYDPVKLLSGNRKLVRESLAGSLKEPQNNLRIFVDGKAAFSEDVAKKEGDAKAHELLAAALTEAGIPGQLDGLLEVCSTMLGSKKMQAPTRLKRAQSWAGGETAHIAVELFAHLKKHVPDAAETILTELESFLLAVEDIEKFPLGEQGIIRSVEEMDALLTRCGSEDWSDSLKTEVVRWLCRFLMGRTTHDISALVNIVLVEDMTESLEKRLLKARFHSLEHYLDKFEPHPYPAKQLWVRLSIVDTDAKSASKIAEYAAQLDDNQHQYFTRTAEKEPPAKKEPEGEKHEGHEAVGGHDDSILFEGELIWKKCQGGKRGVAEFRFLREAIECHTDAVVKSKILPRLAGYRCHDDLVCYIGMSNLLHGLTKPAVLDVKMGTRTYNTSVPSEKAEKQAKKAATSTSASHGVRIVGGKLLENGEWVKVGYKNGDDVVDEQGLKQVLGRFLCTPALRSSAAAKIRDVQAWFNAQSSTSFYAASLLFAYDTVKQDECRINLIDFANCEEITDKAEDLSGFDVGLENLLRLIPNL